MISRSIIRRNKAFSIGVSHEQGTNMRLFVEVRHQQKPASTKAFMGNGWSPAKSLRTSLSLTHQWTWA
jgi:hypothetical protein